MELGENTLVAAKRELFEETGISESQAVFCSDPFMCSDSITRDSNGRMLFHYLIAQIFAVVDPGGSFPTAAASEHTLTLTRPAQALLPLPATTRSTRRGSPPTRSRPKCAAA